MVFCVALAGPLTPLTGGEGSPLGPLLGIPHPVRHPLQAGPQVSPGGLHETTAQLEIEPMTLWGHCPLGAP